MIKVLIADDHKIFRVGIRRIIDDEGDMTTVAEAGNGLEALEACRRLRPDVAVLDFEMPEMDGLEATKAILAEMPGMNIIILTVYDSEEHAARFLSAGARGFLPKVISPDELPAAIRNLMAGRTHISFISKSEARRHPAEAASPLAPQQPHAPLSDRENEILLLIAKGKAVKEIAYELKISETTVRTHRQHIMDKLSLQNNSGITRYAIVNNLITG